MGNLTKAQTAKNRLSHKPKARTNNSLTPRARKAEKMANKIRTQRKGMSLMKKAVEKKAKTISPRGTE